MGTGWADAAGAQSLAQNTGDITSLLSARLMAQKLAWAQQNAQAMDAGAADKADAARIKGDQADFIARKKAMDPFEDRILKRQEGEAETGLKKQQLSQAAQEASLRANLENERMGMEGQQLNELMRHNRAQEGIESKRIDATGANRTVQVRSVDPNSGQETIEFLTPAEARARGAMKAPPTAAAKKEMADSQSGLDALKNIDSLYQDDYVGPWNGRVGAVENATGFHATPERAAFTTAVAALKNQVIKDITGKQMSGPEAKRILDAVPDVTQPAVVFKARMEETRKNLERMRQSVGAPPQPGTGTPSAPASAAAPTSAYDLYLQRLKGGG